MTVLIAPEVLSIAETLGAPLQLGRLRLRNRFVSAPMERNYCEIDGTMTDRYIDYLARRAAGGTALVFTEASYVRADGKGRIRQMGVDVDERIPGIARMADAVHAHGALVGVELNHGGRTAQGAVSGFVPVAPTPIPCAVVGGEMPEELEADDIEYLIECYGEAAARCERAGVDVISLHGGHGYLIHQFLSPAYNKRTDEWADPVLFANRVIDAVRTMAPGVALGLRFSAFEGVEGGLDAETTRDRIAAIDTDRLDFLDVSAGNYEAGQWIIQPGEWSRGLLAPYAQPYARDYDIPVGVAGRISSPEVAAAIVASGQADFVSMARTLHADPDFPNRVLDGGRYRPCIACNYCIDSLAAGPVPCSVNPWVGREADQPDKPADTAVRVAVVGGGPSGLAAARELALVGHEVDLYDERADLGGDFALASALHEYPECPRIVSWYREAAAVADDLLARGASVVLIVPQEQIAQDVGRRAKIVLLPRLASSPGLSTYTRAVITETAADRVRIKVDGVEQWIDAPGQLLVSHGIEPRTDVLTELRSLAPRLGVHLVGDASGDGGSIHAANVTAVDVAARITNRLDRGEAAARDIEREEDF